MFISNLHLPQKSLPKKQEKQDELFSRVLTKESSMENPSFKVYYGGLPANIPFMWESQPGTPKHNKINDETLPPLTPPPSYFSNNPNKKPFKKHSRSNILRILLLKISLKKSHFLPRSPSSSSSSSSLFSKSDLSIRVPMHSCRSRFLSPRSSFDSRGDCEEEGVVGSPTSTLCFGMRRMSSGAKRDDRHHDFN